MNSKYLRSFLHFFSASFLARLISLIREILLALFVGPSKILDIFFFLISIPNLINQVWNRPFETVLLTKYEFFKQNMSSTEAKEELSKLLLNVFVISVIIYLLSSIILPFIIYFFYLEYFAEEIIKIIFLINIVIVVETFILSIKIVKFSENRFFLPTILPVIQNIILVLGILYFTNKITLLIISILFSIGSILQLIVLFKKELNVFLKIFRNRISILKNKEIFKVGTQLSIAAGLSSLNFVIDQSFALDLGEASNSYIHYGYYFLGIYSFLIVRNLNTVIFPQYQKYVFEKKHDELLSDVQKTLQGVLVLSLVATVFIINNGYFVFETLIGYGKITEEDLLIIYYCTLGYTGAFLGTAANAVLVRVLHVYFEYQLILKVAVVNFSINIIFNILLIKLFGVWGIALSTSFSFFVIIIIYIAYLYFKRNFVIFKNMNWNLKYVLFVLIIIFVEYYIINYTPGYINQSFYYNIIVFIITAVSLLFLIALLKLIDLRKIQFPKITK